MCDANYVGGLSARCCWDSINNLAYWTVANAEGTEPSSCALPSATCPTSDTALHAEFAAGTTVQAKQGACTPRVYGRCVNGYTGAIEAKCCWGGTSIGATWRRASLNSSSGPTTSCIKLEGCPPTSAALHASFAPGTLAPKGACSAAVDGRCKDGYAGHMIARCCWVTGPGDAESENVSSWVAVGGARCRQLHKCPRQSDKLHATFATLGVTVADPAACSSAPTVAGVCDMAYNGTVTAKCCWQNTSATDAAPSGFASWDPVVPQLLDLAAPSVRTSASQCVKVADCPLKSFSLHATFKPAVVEMQAGSCSPSVFAQCPRGFYGSVEARCCWNATTSTARWYLAGTDTAPRCRLLWHVYALIIVGLVAMMTITAAGSARGWRMCPCRKTSAAGSYAAVEESAYD